MVMSMTVLVITSCEKKLVSPFQPGREFTPTSISTITHDTLVTISWPPSLYSANAHVTYLLQISKDSSFTSTPDFSLVVDTTFLTITDDSLADRQRYFVRLRANATSIADSSNWLYGTGAFTLTGVQIFGSLLPADILDNAVRLSWTTTRGVDHIVFTAASGKTNEVQVSSQDNSAGLKIVSGLQPGTDYTAEIFSGSKSKGILRFMTKPAVIGNIIDLRDIAGRPTVLNDTLSQISSGSIVLLARGQTYTFASSYTFDRAVTIMSGMGFSDPAVLLLSGNFDATGTIDSLRFSDLTIATDGSGYFMNVSNAATIGTVSVVNCTTRGEFSNSFIRLKTVGDVISKLFIKNSVLDSIGVKSKYAMFYANASSSALIDNIEIHNSTFYDFYYFIREDKVTTSSLLIDNCTFDALVNQGGYFINYTTFPPKFTISNSIFGSTLDPANSNWIKSSGNPEVDNSYATSDCVFSSNDIFGVTKYSGISADLFRSPETGDFTIIDNGFSGITTTGDPRWRP